MSQDRSGAGFSLGAGSYDYDALMRGVDAALKEGDPGAMATAIESARVPAHPPEQPAAPVAEKETPARPARGKAPADAAKDGPKQEEN